MNYQYQYYTNDMAIINNIAKKYYDNKTYEHAKRVAAFVYDDPKVLTYKDASLNFLNYCIALALCHDLFEDTKCPHNTFNDELVRGINILTRKPDEAYNDYCNRIGMRDIALMDDIEIAAWLVKIADMKDHLTQTATLTDRLKAKYLEGMAYLL